MARGRRLHAFARSVQRAVLERAQWEVDTISGARVLRASIAARNVVRTTPDSAPRGMAADKGVDIFVCAGADWHTPLFSRESLDYESRKQRGGCDVWIGASGLDHDQAAPRDPPAKSSRGESTWMGFSSFQDVVICLDVRGVPNNLTFNFDVSPSKDGNLFVTLGSIGPLTSPLSPGVQLPLPKAILQIGPSVPLATWLRWRLTPGGASGNTWDATFKVLVAANRVVREPAQIHL